MRVNYCAYVWFDIFSAIWVKEYFNYLFIEYFSSSFSNISFSRRSPFIFEKLIFRNSKKIFIRMEFLMIWAEMIDSAIALFYIFLKLKSNVSFKICEVAYFCEPTIINYRWYLSISCAFKHSVSVEFIVLKFLL